MNPWSKLTSVTFPGRLPTAFLFAGEALPQRVGARGAVRARTGSPDRVTPGPANRALAVMMGHDEISERVWNSPAVKSPANCAACHTAADQGAYSEHPIRLPE